MADLERNVPITPDSVFEWLRRQTVHRGRGHAPRAARQNLA
jgi:hypothetical protein